MKSFVVIPIYNEGKHIQKVISETRKYVDNIVVVDDGSKDNTKETLKEIQEITVLTHIVNLWKGSALKTGCEYAKKEGANKIVVLDGDGQHDPKEIPYFLNKLDNHDIVFGCRKRSNVMPFVFRFGNWFLTKTIENLFKIKLNDTQGGYRAFTVDAYDKIKWQSTDYSVESEMIANTGKAGLNYTEISIETIYNDKYKGTTIIDGFKIFLKMINWRLG